MKRSALLVGKTKALIFVILFTEQVTVCAGACQCYYQNIIFYAVDKEPIGEDMAFPMTCPIAG